MNSEKSVNYMVVPFKKSNWPCILKTNETKKFWRTINPFALESALFLNPPDVKVWWNYNLPSFHAWQSPAKQNKKSTSSCIWNEFMVWFLWKAARRGGGAATTHKGTTTIICNKCQVKTLTPVPWRQLELPVLTRSHRAEIITSERTSHSFLD